MSEVAETCNGQLERSIVALESLKDLTAGLATATSSEEIGRALLRVAKRFDMTTALIIDAARLVDRVASLVVFATHDREDVEAFDRRQPFAHHPFTRRARASEQPFLMSSLRQAEGLADERAWRAAMPESIHEADGIVVPVHDLGELVWCAAFAGREADLSHRAQSVLSAAVHAGYSAYRMLQDTSRYHRVLSRREMECLRWVADGKTDYEVGKILSISPRTVRFHITNAKEKLGVKSRIQAVTMKLNGLARHKPRAS